MMAWRQRRVTDKSNLPGQARNPELARVGKGCEALSSHFISFHSCLCLRCMQELDHLYLIACLCLVIRSRFISCRVAGVGSVRPSPSL